MAGYATRGRGRGRRGRGRGWRGRGGRAGGGLAGRARAGERGLQRLHQGVRAPRQAQAQLAARLRARLAP